jgi:hypothetical protein
MIDERDDPPEATGEPAAPEQPEPAQKPDLKLLELPPPGSEVWRSQSSGCRQWGTYGCIGGILLLIAALLAGYLMLKQGVWLTFERTRQRVLHSVPYRLPPGEKVRLQRNLERLRDHLRQADDPYPPIGRFLNQAGAALQDGELSPEEIATLNAFVELECGPSELPSPGERLHQRSAEDR